MQTFDLRTPRLLGFLTFKVPSSESPANHQPIPVNNFEPVTLFLPLNLNSFVLDSGGFIGCLAELKIAED